RDGNWFIQKFTWGRAIPRTCFSKRTPMPFPWNRRPWHRKAWTLGSHIWNWLDAVETKRRCDARSNLHPPTSRSCQRRHGSSAKCCSRSPARSVTKNSLKVSTNTKSRQRGGSLTAFPDASRRPCRSITIQARKARRLPEALFREDLAAAREKAIRVIEKLRGLRLSRAAELVEAAIEETLAYYAFPEEHWRRIRTNNPLERILREIRRRTRVVGAFPDGQSALNLAAARLRHIAGTAWSTKRYLNIELLKD